MVNNSILILSIPSVGVSEIRHIKREGETVKASIIMSASRNEHT